MDGLKISICQSLKFTKNFHVMPVHAYYKIPEIYNPRTSLPLIERGGYKNEQKPICTY